MSTSYLNRLAADEKALELYAYAYSTGRSYESCLNEYANNMYSFACSLTSSQNSYSSGNRSSSGNKNFSGASSSRKRLPIRPGEFSSIGTF
jgi:hypothetical protein